MSGAVVRGEYPADWPEISLQVREEAGNRCVRCGHPAGDTLIRYEEGTDRVLMACDERCSHERDERLRMLTVHHLDGDKANCAWWNLPALCQVCHLSVQARVQLAQAYLHEHSGWFRIYAAGYYAHAVLGLELTRQEAEARIEELLTAGQPWRAGA